MARHNIHCMPCIVDCMEIAAWWNLSGSQAGRQAGYIASVSVRACALMWTSERAPLCICPEYNAQTAMAKDRSIISPEPEKKEPFSFYAHLILVVVWYFYTYRRFTLSFRRCVKMNRKYNNNTYLRSFIIAISVFNLPHYLRLTFVSLFLHAHTIKKFEYVCVSYGMHVKNWRNKDFNAAIQFVEADAFCDLI